VPQGFTNLPLDVLVPIPNRGDCINDAEFRWKAAIVDAIKRLARHHAVIINNIGDPSVMGIGVELREIVSGPAKSMSDRILDANWASIMAPGDRTMLAWVNAITGTYGILVMGGEVVNVPTNPAGPYGGGLITIMHHASARPALVTATTATVNHTWLVTDAGTQDDVPIIAAGLGTKYDSYLALALAFATLPPYDNINTAVGLNQFFYITVQV